MSVERAFEQIHDAEKRRRVSQMRAVQPLAVSRRPCLGVQGVRVRAPVRTGKHARRLWRAALTAIGRIRLLSRLFGVRIVTLRQPPLLRDFTITDATSWRPA
jgi:hypothetical protein